MTNSQFSLLILVLFLLLAALTLTLISVLTDYWYVVEAGSTVNNTAGPYWNYNYGLWRKCYDDIPTDVTKNRFANCITIYQDLIKDDETSLSKDDTIYLHLSRTVMGGVIAMGAVQFAAVFTLLCGIWPGDCKRLRTSKIYFTTSLVLLFAAICGIASGICFIAIRDMDRNDRDVYPDGVNVQYGWSFMVTWIAAGLSLFDSFILLCMMKNAYDDVNDLHKSSYYNMGE